MTAFVLDASVVIALLKQERADFDLSELVPGNPISAINLAEVIDRFARDGNPRDAIAEMLAPLDLAIVTPDEASAWRVGLYREKARTKGLSQGDCFCLVLAEQMALPLLTTDGQLALAASELGLKVSLARRAGPTHRRCLNECTY